MTQCFLLIGHKDTLLLLTRNSPWFTSFTPVTVATKCLSKPAQTEAVLCFCGPNPLLVGLFSFLFFSSRLRVSMPTLECENSVIPAAPASAIVLVWVYHLSQCSVLWSFHFLFFKTFTIPHLQISKRASLKIMKWRNSDHINANCAKLLHCALKRVYLVTK